MPSPHAPDPEAVQAHRNGGRQRDPPASAFAGGRQAPPCPNAPGGGGAAGAATGAAGGGGRRAVRSRVNGSAYNEFVNNDYLVHDSFWQHFLLETHALPEATVG